MGVALNKEKEWKEYLEDFLVGAEGKHEHFKSNAIVQDRACVKHAMYSDTEKLIWYIDNKSNRIIEVHHVER